MRVGLGRGRQERTFQVEGTACAMTCVREESKMESSGKKERARFFRSMYLSGVAVSSTAHYSLLESGGTQSLFLKVFYILHKVFQRRVICFHWSTCFHSGASDFLHVTGDISLWVYVYKWRLRLFIPLTYFPLLTCHSHPLPPHSCNRQSNWIMTRPGQH